MAQAKPDALHGYTVQEATNLGVYKDYYVTSWTLCMTQILYEIMKGIFFQKQYSI